MTKKILSGRNDLERALQRIDDSLTRSVTAYLIGGCAMMLYNAKTSTKDVDLVILLPQDAKSVIEALSKDGFKSARPEDDTCRRAGATTVMEDEKGIRIDIFVESVCRKLRISTSMAKRSKLHARYKRLEVRLVSPEDIFLFKSVTERAGDLDDMALLSERGLDWNVILEECIRQSGEVILESYLAVRLQELEDEKGIVSPIRKNLEDITERKLSSMRP